MRFGHAFQNHSVEHVLGLPSSRPRQMVTGSDDRIERSNQSCTRLMLWATMCPSKVGGSGQMVMRVCAIGTWVVWNGKCQRDVWYRPITRTRGRRSWHTFVNGRNQTKRWCPGDADMIRRTMLATMPCIPGHGAHFPFRSFMQPPAWRLPASPPARRSRRVLSITTSPPG